MTEISEAEGRTVYIVRIEETDYEELAEGEIVRLYDETAFEEEPAVGGIYLFELFISADGSDEGKYLIIDIRDE